MKIDSGYVRKTPYRYKNHERYDLSSGNSYIVKDSNVYYTYGQGIDIDIIQQGNSLSAQLKTGQQFEVEKV